MPRLNKRRRNPGRVSASVSLFSCAGATFVLRFRFLGPARAPLAVRMISRARSVYPTRSASPTGSASPARISFLRLNRFLRLRPVFWSSTASCWAQPVSPVRFVCSIGKSGVSSIGSAATLRSDGRRGEIEPDDTGVVDVSVAALYFGELRGTRASATGNFSSTTNRPDARQSANPWTLYLSPNGARNRPPSFSKASSRWF